MLARALNLLFPPQCLVCNAIVPEHGTLCLECWQKIRFITEPMCAACGLPFDFALGENALCGDCMRDLPSFKHARAVFRYDEHSRALITKFKYADQTHLAKTYGTWLAKAGKELILQSDIIVPVPLYYWRLVHRRYNQSALLAKALSAHTGLTWQADALRRVRPTLQQTGLSRSQREDNVRGAFVVDAKQCGKIKKNRVLLIDDVMTTASTLEHCAKALLKAGAKQVNALTLARRAE